MLTHYVDIHVCGDPDESTTIMTQIFGAIHSFIRQSCTFDENGHQEQIAIAFPDLHRATRSKFGDVLRVFGEPEILSILISQPKIEGAKRMGNARVYPVMPIPEAKGWLLTRRDRNPDRYGKAYSARMLRATKKRSETEGKSFSKNTRKARPESDRPTSHPYFLYQAHAGAPFALWVVQEKIWDAHFSACGKFTSYGLGAKPNAVVPSFN